MVEAHAAEVPTEKALDALAGTVGRLKENRSFDNAQQFCIDTREAWRLVWSRWTQSHPDEAAKRAELRTFAALCRDGVRLLIDVQPAEDQPAQASELAYFIRNCRLRWVFARTLIEEGVEQTRLVIQRSIDLAESAR